MKFLCFLVMGKKNDLLRDNGRNFHTNSDGSWGTDEGDGALVAEILRGIGDMIGKILTAKKSK